jgi:hypothetical protein
VSAAADHPSAAHAALIRILDAAPVPAVLIVHPGARLLHANPAAQAVAGSGSLDPALIDSATARARVDEHTELVWLGPPGSDSDSQGWRRRLERLEHAVASAEVGLWEYDPDRDRYLWDAQMHRIMGWDPEHEPPSGAEFTERLVHPEDRAAHRRARAALMAGGGRGELEFRVRAGDGSWRHILSRRVAQTDTAGRVTRVFGATLDLTELRASERGWREADRLLRQAVQATGIAVWERNLVSGAARWDELTFRLLGLDPAAGVPPTEAIVERVHPEDRARYDAMRRAYFDSSAMQEIEFRIVRADGAVRTLVSRGQVIRDAQGRPQRALGTLLDVTDSREQERARQALLARAQLAAEAVGLGVWEHDVVSGRVVWDEQMYRLYGRSPSELTDLHNHWNALLHPEDAARSMREALRALEVGDRFENVVRVPLPGGSLRYIAHRSRIERDAAGRALRQIGVAWDVTEQRLTENAWRARDAAERASRAKTEALTHLGHELRAPLNAILGYAQVLSMDRSAPLRPAQAEHVQHIQTAGWRLLDLLNQALALSRLDSGQLRLTLGLTPLAPVIEEVIAWARPAAAERGISPEVEFAADAPAAAWADRLRLAQVLGNLVSNAIKYNRPGGPLRVSVSGADGEAVVAVRDGGAGLSARQLDALFTPWSRLGPGQARTDGYGVGLAISLRLAEQMGGTLEVSSAPGAGSEFRLRLPAGARELPLAPDGSPARRDEVRGNVLLASTRPELTEHCVRMLELRPGVSLMHAGDGASALVLAGVLQPELVVIDLDGDEIDGEAWILALRAQPGAEQLACVALTSRTEDVGRWLAAGYAACWNSPPGAAQCLSALDRLLGAP